MLHSRLMRPSTSTKGIDGVTQLGLDGRLQLIDQPFGGAAFRVDPGAKRLVGLRLEIAERQLFELVLDLAHPQPVGDGRVDVARFLGDRNPPVLGQVAQGPHVVQPVGQLDQDDPDVIHHGQQHLAEVLGLSFFARREPNGANLGDAFDDMGDLGAEQLTNPVDGRQGVFDDVVEQAGGNRHRVELHVRQKVRNCKRMNQIRLARMADLAPVLERREHVGPAEELDVGVRAVGPDFFEQIFEADHGMRCLSVDDGGFKAS